MVVAVIGSTEESSVDDIDTILTIRDKYAKLVKMLSTIKILIEFYFKRAKSITIFILKLRGVNSVNINENKFSSGCM